MQLLKKLKASQFPKIFLVILQIFLFTVQAYMNFCCWRCVRSFRYPSFPKNILVTLYIQIYICIFYSAYQYHQYWSIFNGFPLPPLLFLTLQKFIYNALYCSFATQGGKKRETRTWIQNRTFKHILFINLRIIMYLINNRILEKKWRNSFIIVCEHFVWHCLV